MARSGHKVLLGFSLSGSGEAGKGTSVNTWNPIRNSGRAKGVTLIEILIVIAIILILMGLLMAALGGVRLRAKMRATRLLLDGISASLHRYHMDFDEFPDSFGAPGYNVTPSSDYESTEDDGRLCAQLNGVDGAGPVRSVGTPYEKRFSSYLPVSPVTRRAFPFRTIPWSQSNSGWLRHRTSGRMSSSPRKLCLSRGVTI